MPDKTIGLAPWFADKIKEFIIEANAQGLNVDLFQGFRSFEEQAALYAQGRTTPGQIVTNARPGYSWHQFGVAGDVVFRDIEGNWTWNVPPAQWHMLAAMGQAAGFDCGAYWPGTLQDLDHFQLNNGMTLEEARDIGDLPTIWKEIQSR